jgi:chromosomal replication initiation ATPase DnaA
MSLNYEGVGRPLAEIVDKDDKFNTKKKYKVVSLAEDHEMDKVKNPFNQLDLQPNQLFMQIPNEKKKRSVIYASGQSGSGKTYYTADYIKKYVQQNPKNRVIVFSSLDSDATLDDIKEVKRVKIKTPGFTDEEFSIDQFIDTLVIFDDTDCMQNKKILDQLNKIADIVLQTGRHTNTSMVFTSHLSCAGRFK